MKQHCVCYKRDRLLNILKTTFKIINFNQCYFNLRVLHNLLSYINSIHLNILLMKDEEGKSNY